MAKKKPFNVDKELRHYRWSHRKAMVKSFAKMAVFYFFDKVFVPLLIGVSSAVIVALIVANCLAGPNR